MYLSRQYQSQLHVGFIDFLCKPNKDRGKPHSLQELKEIYTKKGKLLESDPSPENLKDFEGIKNLMDNMKRVRLTERSDQTELKAKTNVRSISFELGDY